MRCEKRDRCSGGCKKIIGSSVASHSAGRRANCFKFRRMWASSQTSTPYLTHLTIRVMTAVCGRATDWMIQSESVTTSAHRGVQLRQLLQNENEKMKTKVIKYGWLSLQHDFKMTGNKRLWWHFFNPVPQNDEQWESHCCCQTLTLHLQSNIQPATYLSSQKIGWENTEEPMFATEAFWDISDFCIWNLNEKLNHDIIYHLSILPENTE